MTNLQSALPLRDTVELSARRLLNRDPAAVDALLDAGRPALVVLAAGKGSRFGVAPKCVQPVGGLPLARHSIEAFRRFAGGPVFCLVHYRQDDVMRALGDAVMFIHSANPVGGTAFAAFEVFSAPGLLERNPLLLLTMGDRIVPDAFFRRLCQAHAAGGEEAELTLLAAEYRPPRQIGKGRIVRDSAGAVQRIVEQRDIDIMTDPVQRRLLQDTTEANCPLYVTRAATLYRYLGQLRNDNAQQQYYITDMVEAIVRDGGRVRALTTTPTDPAYDLLCADVTRPEDLAQLERVLEAVTPIVSRQRNEVEQAAAALCRDRPVGQVDAIAHQLRELVDMAEREKLGFSADRPVALGVSGGRLRIAFMHPDMGRFLGPAWQMPIGSANAGGREQILVMVQGAEDGNIHLFPADSEFREKLDALPADNALMYPSADIADWYAYEGFGTRMAEHVLLSLGYFSDSELQRRRDAGLPLPPASLWVCNGMRRPFALIANAIASIRTLRDGPIGRAVQACMGREAFQGLRLASNGKIPRGGFSSSSAVTVAVKNAVNALYALNIPPDLLVHLACQAEYGTGVRAGSLDQATAQKGKSGQGTLLSSNPRDNYRVLGVFPAPTDRFQVVFPYSVDRDRAAWQWSAGMYGETAQDPLPTTSEIRKLTGKAAEIAAILLRLPLDRDFFPRIEPDLLSDGRLCPESARWVADTLRALPLCIGREALWRQLRDNRAWLAAEWRRTQGGSNTNALAQADATLDALMSGWRDPLLRLPDPDGRTVFAIGVPLRAMLGYLFGEVAKNFELINRPGDWIAIVTRSQAGDRCLDINPDSLPDGDAMLGELPWENGASGPDRLSVWLERVGARPVDFNRGLDDTSLSRDPPPALNRLEGGNFFRGLALIDLAEAMLKRAFGREAVAVRINAAGQGDYFQLHIDTRCVDVETVQHFIRLAFYRRFGLSPAPAFIKPHPGGPAVGVRLGRYDQLPALIQSLESFSSSFES